MTEIQIQPDSAQLHDVTHGGPDGVDDRPDSKPSHGGRRYLGGGSYSATVFSGSPESDETADLGDREREGGSE